MLQAGPETGRRVFSSLTHKAGKGRLNLSPVVGEGSGVAEPVRREGPRRNRAGRPLQGGTGGPPPESFRWSSAAAGHGHKPGGTRGFSRSANDDRPRARGGRFRAAPHDPASGAWRSGSDRVGFAHQPGFFGPARSRLPHPRRSAGRDRQAGGRAATAANDARHDRPDPRVSSGRGRKAAPPSPPARRPLHPVRMPARVPLASNRWGDSSGFSGGLAVPTSEAVERRSPNRGAGAGRWRQPAPGRVRLPTWVLRRGAGSASRPHELARQGGGRAGRAASGPPNRGAPSRSACRAPVPWPPWRWRSRRLWGFGHHGESSGAVGGRAPGRHPRRQERPRLPARSKPTTRNGAGARCQGALAGADRLPRPARRTVRLRANRDIPGQHAMAAKRWKTLAMAEPPPQRARRLPAVPRRRGERAGAARLLGAAPARKPPRPAQWTVEAQPSLARAKPAPLVVGCRRPFPGARPPGLTRDASERGAREGAGSVSVSERPATGPPRRGSAAERGQAGQAARRACRASRARFAREGKDRGVAVLASGRRPFPEIGVRAGSAPPRRDARRFPWPGNAGVQAATARLRRCKFDFNNGYH